MTRDHRLLSTPMSGLLRCVVVLLFAFPAGCGGPADPFAGTWVNEADRVVLHSNGTGEGRLFGNGRAEPLTWQAPQGSVAVTFGASPSESRTYAAASDGNSLVFRNGDLRSRLVRPGAASTARVVSGEIAP